MFFLERNYSQKHEFLLKESQNSGWIINRNPFEIALFIIKTPIRLEKSTIFRKHGKYHVNRMRKAVSFGGLTLNEIEVQWSITEDFSSSPRIEFKTIRRKYNISEIEEVSKAASEVSKFGTTAVQTTEKIFSFLAKVFHEPIAEISGMIGDKLKFLRWQRQVRMADEVERIIQARSIMKTIPIPPKFAIPMIENASLEEDDELQDLWNKLMANSMDPSFKIEMRFAYIEIVKSLNPNDVKILKLFYDVLREDPKVDMSKILNYSLKREQLVHALIMEDQDCLISIYNLFRVQCLAPAIIKGGMSIGSETMTIYKGADAVSLTPLGINLIKSCIL